MNTNIRSLSLDEVDTVSGGTKATTFKGKSGTTYSRQPTGTINVNLPNGDVLQFGENGIAASIGGKWVP